MRSLVHILLALLLAVAPLATSAFADAEPHLMSAGADMDMDDCGGEADCCDTVDAHSCDLDDCAESGCHSVAASAPAMLGQRTGISVYLFHTYLLAGSPPMTGLRPDPLFKPPIS